MARKIDLIDLNVAVVKSMLETKKKLAKENLYIQDDLLYDICHHNIVSHSGKLTIRPLRR